MIGATGWTTLRSWLTPKVVALPVAQGGSARGLYGSEAADAKRLYQAPRGGLGILKFLTSKEAIALENQIEAPPAETGRSEDEELKNDPWQSAFVSQLHTGAVIDPINWELPIRDIIEAVQLVAYGKN